MHEIEFHFIEMDNLTFYSLFFPRGCLNLHVWVAIVLFIPKRGISGVYLFKKCTPEVFIQLLGCISLRLVSLVFSFYSHIIKVKNYFRSQPIEETHTHRTIKGVKMPHSIHYNHSVIIWGYMLSI